ncbi:MAG: hypothetical protein ACKVRO_18585 [Micropepsaceae bacterium]
MTHSRFNTTALLLLCGLVLISCDQFERQASDKVGAPDGKATAKNSELDDLRSRVSSLEVFQKSLEWQVKDLTEQRAELTTEPGYSLLRNSFGVFPISYNKAVPYLDGHKIYLDVGNPTNMRFVGAKIVVEYGSPAPRTADGKLDFANWGEYRAGRREYETSVTNEFAPGWYTTIELIITPSKPEQVRELSASVQFNQLKLTGVR